jgi:Ca2+/H+ antiporter
MWVWDIFLKTNNAGKNKNNIDFYFYNELAVIIILLVYLLFLLYQQVRKHQSSFNKSRYNHCEDA